MRGVWRKKVMKKMMIAAAAVLLSGCFSPVEGELDDVIDDPENCGGEAVSVATKKFTFTLKGDFGDASFSGGDDLATEPQGTRAATRAAGYLSADGQDMTDLWVFDYMGGQCVQSVHQTAGDEAWGQPTLALAYGSHHVYFVASRGDEPSVDADGHAIAWGTPRDTFWKDYEVEVVSTSNGNRAVTLDRVATKLRLVVNDEVPTGCSSVTVTPDRWYYGLDYVAGAAVSQQRKERSVSVPASLVGTTGQLAVSIFGLSGSDEWTTNVTVTAKDADGVVLGTAAIVGAPFKRNRSTEYSGSLFGSAGSMDVGLNADWESPKTGTW